MNGHEGTETILVVEDDPSVLLYVRMVLQKAAYNVVAVSSGEEAIALMQRDDVNVHAVISDVIMPSMTGVELHENLSRLRPGLKMILMSGYSADTVPGGLADNIIFLQKPVSKAMLHSAVREALEQSVLR